MSDRYYNSNNYYIKLIIKACLITDYHLYFSNTYYIRLIIDVCHMSDRYL